MRLHFLSLGLSTTLAAQTPGLGYAEATGEILRLLDSVPLIAIADVHALAEEGDFYLRLLRHPRVPGTINDVIVELGNELYQQVADRYVAGERVPVDSVRMIWENTTQGPLLTAWAPMYGAILHAVRDINRHLPATRRIRVLLGDPAVEWKTVTRSELWEIHKHRGDRMRELARDSVIARGRRGILIAGGHHIRRQKGQAGSDRKWGPLADRVYIIGVHTGFGGRTARFEPLIAALPTGSLVPVHTTLLGELDIDEMDLATPAAEMPPDSVPSFESRPGMTRPNAGIKFGEQYDGYLYLGPVRNWTLSRPDLEALKQDRVRVHELQRRACLMMGRPMDSSRLFQPADPRYFPGGIRGSQVEYDSTEPPAAAPPPLPRELPESCAILMGRP